MDEAILCKKMLLGEVVYFMNKALLRFDAGNKYSRDCNKCLLNDYKDTDNRPLYCSDECKCYYR
jgi:hypothetical protein